ncbi:MAG: protein kinase [Myxococcaceae bacterium]|nr:protein kinase [Myxococcaceae bacterium]
MRSELEPKFRIQTPLRCDGVGSLDCAEDTQSGTRLAIRWLPVDANGEAAVKALEQIPQHPVLPRIRQTGRLGSSAWVAMDFPEGRLLSTMIGLEPIASGHVLRMGASIAGALATLHAQKIVHGELSADSVLMLEEGRAILWDAPLVLANRLTDRRGEERALALLIKVAPYLAPERARGLPVSMPSDVYALGAVMCMAAGGQLPPGGTTLAVVHQIATGQWTPELPRAFGPAVRAVVKRMIDPDPLARLTASEAAQALAMCCERLPNPPERRAGAACVDGARSTAVTSAPAMNAARRDERDERMSSQRAEPTSTHRTGPISAQRSELIPAQGAGRMTTRQSELMSAHGSERMTAPHVERTDPPAAESVSAEQGGLMSVHGEQLSAQRNESMSTVGVERIAAPHGERTDLPGAELVSAELGGRMPVHGEWISAQRNESMSTVGVERIAAPHGERTDPPVAESVSAELGGRMSVHGEWISAQRDESMTTVGGERIAASRGERTCPPGAELVSAELGGRMSAHGEWISAQRNESMSALGGERTAASRNEVMFPPGVESDSVEQGEQMSVQVEAISARRSESMSAPDGERTFAQRAEPTPASLAGTPNVERSEFLSGARVALASAERGESMSAARGDLTSLPSDDQASCSKLTSAERGESPSTTLPVTGPSHLQRWLMGAAAFVAALAASLIVVAYLSGRPVTPVKEGAASPRDAVTPAPTAHAVEDVSELVAPLVKSERRGRPRVHMAPKDVVASQPLGRQETPAPAEQETSAPAVDSSELDFSFLTTGTPPPQTELKRPGF